MTIIGRQYEQKQLQKVLESNEAEFVAIYGRRRVGKTYLIRTFFEGKKCIFFRSSGIHNGSLELQLGKFKQEIEDTFYQGRKGVQLSDFSSWHDALQALKDAIDIFSENQKVVIFLDELPWMATAKSGLVEALDYYWNRYWSADKRVKLIICGSAASWIIEHVIHDTGGLHNRITLKLPMSPFSLAEAKAYLKYRKINYTNKQVLALYMCIGGIPYYLRFVEKGVSAIQNVSQMCFDRKGALFDEFNLLFASLFKNHEACEALIRLIAKKRNGVARTELEASLDYKGGRLSARLKELEEAGFIIPFIPWKKDRGVYYKAVDEYTLFYLTWVEPKAASRMMKSIDDQYWETMSSKPAWLAWSGYAFEAICFKHITQICKALKIPGGSEVSSWKYTAKKADKINGAQIDLIINRPDGAINLCEIKYCDSPYKLDKQYASVLLQREEIYRQIMKTDKQIFHSMIVAGGLKETMYSEAVIASVCDLGDLFTEG